MQTKAPDRWKTEAWHMQAKQWFMHNNTSNVNMNILVIRAREESH